MGLARSTYYDEPEGQPIAEARLVERIKEICAEWSSYGYRRVTAQLHAEGIIANHKKVMRLMREHGLTVRPHRRFVATTDGDHDGPIFPNLAKDVVLTGPNQLWVADITYIAIATGFVYTPFRPDMDGKAVRHGMTALHATRRGAELRPRAQRLSTSGSDALLINFALVAFVSWDRDVSQSQPGRSKG